MTSLRQSVKKILTPGGSPHITPTAGPLIGAALAVVLVGAGAVTASAQDVIRTAFAPSQLDVLCPQLDTPGFLEPEGLRQACDERDEPTTPTTTPSTEVPPTSEPPTPSETPTETPSETPSETPEPTETAAPTEIPTPTGTPPETPTPTETSAAPVDGRSFEPPAEPAPAAVQAPVAGLTGWVPGVLGTVVAATTFDPGALTAASFADLGAPEFGLLGPQFGSAISADYGIVGAPRSAKITDLHAAGSATAFTPERTDSLPVGAVVIAFSVALAAIWLLRGWARSVR